MNVRLSAMLLLAILIVAISGGGAGTAVAEPADAEPAQASIIRGTHASIEDFPWLANVSYEGAVDAMGCTGTVIAPRVVLTAAHCVLSGAGRVERPGGFTVTTGIADMRLAKPANRSRVGKVLIFPGHDRLNNKFDAALLILSNPVSAPSLPLADWTDAGLLAPGAPLTVAGWGLINKAPDILPTTLRRADTVIQDAAYCRQQTKGLFPFLPAYQLCALPPPGGEAITCNGDSGGPGIGHRSDGTPVLVGIIDLGSPGCETRVPEVLVRVDRISDWAERWIDAVEFGDPAPRVWVPRIRIPYLGKELAKSFAFVGLAEDLGPRFLQGRALSMGCFRLERAKVKCGVGWRRGRERYSGTVTAFYAIRPEGELWHYRYRIRWVDQHCWATSSHRKACTIGTRAR